MSMPRVTATQTALFASDLHLSADALETAQQAMRLLSSQGPSADHLFLLGDLFEMWVGDDGTDTLAQQFSSLLRKLADSGTRVWMMRGNRDFLIDVPLPGRPGSCFTQQCGAELLEDPCLIDLQGTPALLTHGDALCTDDQVYQTWRSTCRDPRWQQAMLARSLNERIAIGRQARQSSEAGKREMSDALADVNQAAVDAMLDSAGADLMIHGHTHRPAHHHWTHQGRARQRLVLTDWDAQAHRGHLMGWTSGKPVPMPQG
jgi:UDP-2,3-diacylglucosamine hydrolase